MKTMFTGWFGVWMFMVVYCICETILYMHGHDTALWQHRTPAEFELQKNIINEAKGECK